MAGKTCLEDVARSYRWLGHHGSLTEVKGLHPSYRPGRVNEEWNRFNGTATEVGFVRSEDELERFVLNCGGSRAVYFGLNPRSRVFTDAVGCQRAAVEDEVELSQNLVLSFRFEDDLVSRSQLGRLDDFLGRADSYFLDLGLMCPVRACTRDGVDLLFAYPPIDRRGVPDLVWRLRKFRDDFFAVYREDLSRLDLRLERSQALRHLVRVCGAADPGAGASRFHGGERTEDAAFRDYLLGLSLPIYRWGGGRLKVDDELPDEFLYLLEEDSGLRDLWLGVGSPDCVACTGPAVDDRLVRRLLWKGLTDLGALASVLTLRPDGEVQRNGAGEEYVRRTIANALVE